MHLSFINRRPAKASVKWLALTINFLFCGFTHFAAQVVGVLAFIFAAASLLFLALESPHLTKWICGGVAVLFFATFHVIRSRLPAPAEDAHIV